MIIDNMIKSIGNLLRSPATVQDLYDAIGKRKKETAPLFHEIRFWVNKNGRWSYLASGRNKSSGGNGYGSIENAILSFIDSLKDFK